MTRVHWSMTLMFYHRVFHLDALVAVVVDVDVVVVVVAAVAF